MVGQCHRGHKSMEDQEEVSNTTENNTFINNINVKNTKTKISAK